MLVERRSWTCRNEITANSVLLLKKLQARACDRGKSALASWLSFWCVRSAVEGNIMSIAIKLCSSFNTNRRRETKLWWPRQLRALQLKKTHTSRQSTSQLRKNIFICKHTKLNQTNMLHIHTTQQNTQTPGEYWRHNRMSCCESWCEVRG